MLYTKESYKASGIVCVFICVCVWCAVYLVVCVCVRDRDISVAVFVLSDLTSDITRGCGEQFTHSVHAN